MSVPIYLLPDIKKEVASKTIAVLSGLYAAIGEECIIEGIVLFSIALHTPGSSQSNPAITGKRAILTRESVRVKVINLGRELL